MLSIEDIESRFGTHKATIEGADATLPKHTDLRTEFKGFVKYLEEILPEGRYKDLMHTALENASMWAHKSIAELAPVVTETRKIVDPGGVYDQVDELLKDQTVTPPAAL